MMKINKKSVAIAGLMILSAVSEVGAQTQITISDPAMGVTNFGNLISAGIKTAMLIAALITFVFLIWGGIQWITSGGDKGNYEAAKNRITAAIIGLAIVASAWALMTLVEQFFNIKVLNGFTIPSAGQGTN